MANNIVGGAPNAIVAKSTVSFATAGITALNTEIIYLVADPLKSYVPGRAINGISGFETGKGYYMVAKVDMDLESIVVPPLSGVTPPDEWTDFDFTTVAPTNALTESPANTWIPGSGAVGGYGNKGLATVKFAAGVDGAIITQITTLSIGNAVFGVSDTNAVAAYSEMEAAFWHGFVSAPGDGTLATTTNGNTASGAISAGDWVGIFRTGSVLKLRKSPDKTNWTDLITFTFTSAGILYPVVDINGGGGKLVNPQYQGLTP